MRGDSSPTLTKMTPASGSPPHAWGQLSAPGGNGGSDRFTPTCVGTARQRISSMMNMAVHPHMRGDSIGIGVSPASSIGSPPHAWGQRRLRPPNIGNRGFTPTCVGTATSKLKPIRPTSVHPHMRGDSNTSTGQPSRRPGSPPHAWGQLILPDKVRPRGRFTPTCVGTAPTVPAAISEAMVHPHMRGDS